MTADELLARYAAGERDFRKADLEGCNLEGCNLEGCNFERANLTGANLVDARLVDANLQRATLEGANLAHDLAGANLAGAILPDGRTYEQWCDDPLAGLCTEPGAVRLAVKAWGKKTWNDCPMRAANGWSGYGDSPTDKRSLLVTFIALHDAGLLPRPKGVTR